MTSKNVLIIDDEPDICELIEMTLARMGLNTRSAGSLAEGYNLLGQQSFDLCLTDMRLPDGNGIEIVEFLQKNHPDLPVAVFTAHGNMETAVRALKAGAFDFVSKPVDIQILRNLVESATTIPAATVDDPETTKTRTTITGNSAAVQSLQRNIAKLARNQAPVFIHGESGSGKERVARMIHEQGSRASHAFVPVNCGAIPAELMESEFFGHVRGSFTGATSDKEGLFQASSGGTLFLDEVAELPLNMQVKLLRAIQEKAVRPVGSQYEVSVDVRILSASHKNLEELVHSGQFRQDLYYRINVIDLAVPSLRDRTEDIPLLAQQMLESMRAKSEVETSPELSEEAVSALQAYPFPGNVRELENILERAFAMSEDHVIEAKDLVLGGGQQRLADVAETATGQPQEQALDLEGQEKSAIMKALEKTRWNKTAAAKLLGLSLRQLRYRLQKFGID